MTASLFPGQPVGHPARSQRLVVRSTRNLATSAPEARKVSCLGALAFAGNSLCICGVIQIPILLWSP